MSHREDGVVSHEDGTTSWKCECGAIGAVRFDQDQVIKLLSRKLSDDHRMHRQVHERKRRRRKKHG